MNANISKALRNIIAERDSYTCVCCENHYTDIHHVVPRSRGGRNNPYNLVALCRVCHSVAHNDAFYITETELYKRGFLTVDAYREYIRQRIVEYISDYYASTNEYGLFLAYLSEVGGL